MVRRATAVFDLVFVLTAEVRVVPWGKALGVLALYLTALILELPARFFEGDFSKGVSCATAC